MLLNYKKISQQKQREAYQKNLIKKQTLNINRTPLKINNDLPKSPKFDQTPSNICDQTEKTIKEIEVTDIDETPMDI